jgi:hypothetical protein
MNLSQWIRQFHRWMAVAFTVGFIVNLVALGGGEPAFWVYLLVLIPLFLLLPTGLYMFVLPYAARWRSGRRIAG